EDLPTKDKALYQELSNPRFKKSLQEDEHQEDNSNSAKPNSAIQEQAKTRFDQSEDKPKEQAKSSDNNSNNRRRRRGGRGGKKQNSSNNPNINNANKGNTSGYTS